jgi:cell division transport system permease protein
MAASTSSSHSQHSGKIMANPPRKSTLPALAKRPSVVEAMMRRSTPVVPRSSVTGRSLTLVIAIMGFLVCLTTGAVYLIGKSAAAWLRGIDAEVTVQIEPDADGVAMKTRSEQVAAFLRDQEGVIKVTPLTEKQHAELVKPWLGHIAALDALPMPQLIAVQIDPAIAADIPALSTALNAKYPGAILDDHRSWRKQIRTVTTTLAVAGVAVIVLVTAATAATIVAAARAALASNKGIVEVLHFVGAEERFIVRQFEVHFLMLGIKAGVVGAGLASLLFLAVPYVTDLLSGRGSAVADTELRRVFGAGELDLFGYGLLGLMVIIIAILCQMTSRMGVRRILAAQNL